MLTRIRTITYLRIVIVIMILLAICLFFNNYVVNRQVEIKSYNRYILKSNVENDSDKNLLVATNYQEYQDILNYYGIETHNRSVHEEFFRKENYAFVLLKNHYLCDSDILRSYSLDKERITLWVEEKDLCRLSMVGNIVYEVPVLKNFDASKEVQIKYVSPISGFVHTS